ncbi:CPBP family intramembrane glutamic endopeptidase [Sutcliffiella deserti]|uniref:CPBP family intramembrane glutamic endopeptidase n=1 Tax=Sutcliffiella deserti TaxID=2875501 RepID=UPI001CBB44AD|nr:CPBP family intramembrane glutamic endopeptidase [Sutcliffiella deserti]
MRTLKLIVGVWILANVLLGLSFSLSSYYFWMLFPFALAVLSFISLKSMRNKKWEKSLFSVDRFDFLFGIISGSILYCFFLFTYLLIKTLNIPLLLNQVHELYHIVGPSQWWHYFMLVLIIIPGEEIFWRGFIQGEIQTIVRGRFSIIVAACLYAFAHIWTGNLMLVAAAATAGVVWGTLYSWKDSLPLVIISHLVFNLWLLIIFPLLF